MKLEEEIKGILEIVEYIGFESMKTHMSRYIFSVMLTNMEYTMCYDFNNPRSKDEDSLLFDVDGLLYKGTVEVKYDRGSDTFSVILPEKTVEYVHVGELTEVVDTLVESGNDKAKYKRNVYNKYYANKENN